MKRLAFICFIFLVSLGARAAEDSNSLAQQRDFEERYKRVVAELEDMKDAYRALQKRTTDMATDIARLREENLQHTQSLLKFATRDDLRKIVDKMQELENKRESDRKLILEQLDKVANATAASVAAAEARAQRQREEKPKAPPVDPNQEYFIYKVESGNTLSQIVEAYNVEFRKEGKKTITVDQVLQANPGLNPQRLYIGREVHIPVPK